MSDKLSELEPCRWCKGTKAKVLDFAESAIHVACPCGVQMFGGRAHFGSREEAIAAWNHRASPAPAIPADDSLPVPRSLLVALVDDVEEYAGRHSFREREQEVRAREIASARAILAAPAISESEDALLTAARRAIPALAHAAERNPAYQRDYEELSKAIEDAARKGGGS